MRWQLASTFAVSAMSAGCYEPDTVDCGNGYLCPAGLACAEPGHCGEPALVEQCFEQSKPNFATCTANAGPGVCLEGICNDCTIDLDGCTFDDSWTPMTSPTTFDLLALWVIPPGGGDPATHAIAGGSNGTLIEYNGREWSLSTTFPVGGADITGVWGSGLDDVWVLQHPAVWHWDGTSWSDLRSTLPDPSVRLFDITGTSRTDVFAVGVEGVILRWNGSWTTVNDFGPDLLSTGIAGRPVAVGAQGYLFTSDGASASGQQVVPGGFTLWDVAGTSELAAVMVGQRDDNITSPPPMIVEYDGTNWAPATFSAGVPIIDVLYAAWGGPTSAFAAGTEGQVLKRGAAGTNWQVDAKLGVTVRAIDGVDDSRLFAVGLMGRVWKHAPP